MKPNWRKENVEENSSARGGHCKVLLIYGINFFHNVSYKEKKGALFDSNNSPTTEEKDKSDRLRQADNGLCITQSTYVSTLKKRQRRNSSNATNFGQVWDYLRFKLDEDSS